jgi:hypothetical protein
MAPLLRFMSSSGSPPSAFAAALSLQEQHGRAYAEFYWRFHLGNSPQFFSHFKPGNWKLS